MDTIQPNAVKGPHFLFVGGPGRSGTTLMGRTIGLHAEARYIEESFLLTRIRRVHDISGELYKDAAVDLKAGEEALYRGGKVREQPIAEKTPGRQVRMAARDLSRQWTDSVLRSLDLWDATLVVDKSPRDVAHYEWAVRNVPRSRYVVMRRDPRAVVASRLEQQERRGGITYEPGAEPDDDVVARALDWADLWLEYLNIAAQARDQSPRRVLFVEYADLITDPRVVAERVQTFAQLDTDPEVAAYLEGGGYRDALLTDQLESWRTRLHPRLIEAVSDRLRDHLEPYGG